MDAVRCAGCPNTIIGNSFMRCTKCSSVYDLICAGVSEEWLQEKRVRKQSWVCVLCSSSMPKTDNSDTPVRGAQGAAVGVRRGAAMPSPEESPEPLNDTALNATMEMSSFQALFVEIRQFREEMRAAVAQITSRMDSCEMRLQKVEARLDEVEQRGDSASSGASHEALIASIEELKAEINDRDQELLSNTLEITCIPEQNGEGLQHICLTVAGKLGVQLAERDVVAVARVGRTSSDAGGGAARPRPIVLRLARRAVRDELLAAARVRRGATTEGTGLPGAPRRFYINERLTRVNRQLFRRARELAARLRWRFVWTRDGRIFARQRDDPGAPRHRLRTEADLQRVFGSDVVCSENNRGK